MKLPKKVKEQIREEQAKIIMEMSRNNIPKEKWNELNTRFLAYEEMLKPAFKISPDTMLVVGGNLVGIVLILYFVKD
jgi:hypothetical protein